MSYKEGIINKYYFDSKLDWGLTSLLWVPMERVEETCTNWLRASHLHSDGVQIGLGLNPISSGYLGLEMLLHVICDMEIMMFGL